MMDRLQTLTLATQLAVACISRVPEGFPIDIAAALHTAHRAVLYQLQEPPVAESSQRPTPAVPVDQSIHDDHLVCLDDGQKFKSLKRHLAGLGMTPDQYRAKWSLPRDYPMVCPAYAQQRSALAKSLGLGRPKLNRDGKNAGSIRQVA